MKMTSDFQNVNNKLQYCSPSVCIIAPTSDILTESYNDPNMGEWDTEDN